MKITILHDCLFTAKHIAELSHLGDLDVQSGITSINEAIDALKNTDVGIIDCIEMPCTKDFFQSTDHLKCLVVNSTGFDAVDLNAAKAKSIIVCNTPAYATDSVAELTMTLLLSILSKLKLMNTFMQTTPCELNPTTSIQHNHLLRYTLKEKTVGIIGLGKIGKAVAKLLKSFDCQLVYYDIVKISLDAEKQLGITFMGLKDVLQVCDILTIHTPLTKQTTHLINNKTLALMKEGVIIINTARGGIIDTFALNEGLVHGYVGGAGLDVLEDWTMNNPLLTAPNTVITPHVGWYAEDSVIKRGDTIVETVVSFCHGKPIHVVNT